MLVDSHCHVDARAFDADRDAVLERALAAGVTDVVVPAVGEESWGPILALSARRHGPRCHAALGLHPVSLVETDAGDDGRCLDALAARASGGGIVAIGECGLDATVDLVRAPLSRQERVLRVQLDLARRLDLPVVLHARGAAAYRRLAQVLAEERLSGAGGVLHSYAGGADLLPLFGPLYFGFAGPATFPEARRVRASVAAVPPERLLAETDAPDQTPVPHRPGRSEPAYLTDVVAGLARIRGAGVLETVARTAENARRLFRIPPA